MFGTHSFPVNTNELSIGSGDQLQHNFVKTSTSRIEDFSWSPLYMKK